MKPSDYPAFYNNLLVLIIIIDSKLSDQKDEKSEETYEIFHNIFLFHIHVNIIREHLLDFLPGTIHSYILY